MPSHRAPFWRRICGSPLPVLALIALAGNTDALVMMHGKQLLAVYMTGDSTRISAALLQGASDKVGALLCVVSAFSPARRSRRGLASVRARGGPPSRSC